VLRLVDRRLNFQGITSIRCRQCNKHTETVKHVIDICDTSRIDGSTVTNDTQAHTLCTKIQENIAEVGNILNQQQNKHVMKKAQSGTLYQSIEIYELMSGIHMYLCIYIYIYIYMIRNVYTQSLTHTFTPHAVGISTYTTTRTHTLADVCRGHGVPCPLCRSYYYLPLCSSAVSFCCLVCM
jgi:hypothetical protein